MIYEEEVREAYTRYTKKIKLYRDIKHLTVMDYVRFYCKQYGVPMSVNNQNKLMKIYKKWKEEQKKEGLI